MAYPESSETIAAFLPKIKLFESLPAEALDDIQQSVTRAHTYQVSKNSIFQTPDDERKGLFLLFAGRLRFYKINADGKQHTVCIQNEGSVFGEVDTFALGEVGSYAEAMEDSTIAFIPAGRFEPFLRKYPELSLVFLSEISRNLRVQGEWVEHLVFGDLRGKVLYFLNRLIGKFASDAHADQEITIPLTHQELADIVGATREAVSLALKELSNEGILSTGRKTITIDLSKMKKELP
ncbi:Crp/Fnr family transcriptional regulator [Saccharibacillus alkalitolerans]|uniref:Crp/Fnr family transcriptional regulator n=1 Tax=Saccharibacillus alkalitolerans TaxID=2705290 RepID=A0ABX0F937_9BACL|nr:Crp/Fnr family transcriptional regulator [Saccharibacillus alkalitolerans]NGZ76534.1 Crp/Fnr family transcriptional regulator [Saccharibacillus alkalitolerans]